MSQAVFVRTDVTIAAPLKAPVESAPSTDAAEFASALDQQLRSSRSPAKTDDKPTATDNSQSAADTTKAEAAAATDGKNLPASESDEQAIAAEDDAKPGADAAEQQGDLLDESASAEIIAAPMDTVEDSLSADGDSETAASTLLAAAQNSNSNSAQNNKAAAAVARQQVSAEATAGKSATDGHKVASPNSDAESKSKNSNSAAPAIRADILQALQDPSRRNKLFAQLRDGQTGRQMAELVSQVRPGQQRTDGGPAPAGLITALTPAASGLTASSNLTTPATALDIQPGLNNPAWAKVMSSRVLWMANQGIQQAELRLNPANLGPVEVRLSLNNDQATVSFIAANAATREALEQSLPRLRDSFTENGMQLTDADVSDQTSEQSEQQQEDPAQVLTETQVNVLVDDNPEQEGGQDATGQLLSTGLSLYA